jgi:hypothetical protein
MDPYFKTDIDPRKEDLLFHFTTLESLRKIASDMTFKTSSLSNLNDLNEGYIERLQSPLHDRYMAVKDYMTNNCHLLSFSQNLILNGIGFLGTCHPAMWAHYADDSHGVCIVLDKKAFKEVNKEIFDNYPCLLENVKYDFINTLEEEYFNFQPQDVKQFVKENHKQIFYLKHSDWKHEDECRLLVLDYPGKFSILECVKFIALGYRLAHDNEKMKELVEIFTTPENACYDKFYTNSFAKVIHGSHGYHTIGCAGQIKEVRDRLGKKGIRD